MTRINGHSSRSSRGFVIAGMAALVIVAGSAALWAALTSSPPPEPPLVDWPVATPESEGLDGAALEALADDLADRRTKALLVARRGRIVLEWYAPDFHANRRHYAASMVKGTAAAPALVTVVQRDLLSLDDRAADRVPAWEEDSERARITIADLAFHRSGLNDVDFDAGRRGELPGWKQRYYDNPGDRYRLAIDSASSLFPAGTGYSYSGVGYYVLSYIVTMALREERVRDIPSLLDEAVYRPIGIPREAWSIGYGRVDTVDGLPLAHFGSGGELTARAAARIGQLFLQGGCWEGEQVLDAGLVAAVLGRGDVAPVRTDNESEPASRVGDGWRPASASAGGWWVDSSGEWPASARQAAAALGYGHQIVWIDPTLELVAARLGEDLSSRLEPFDFALTRHFVAPLYEAVADAEPSHAAASDVADGPWSAGGEGRSCKP